jgi:hypothetical protein
MNLIGLVGEYGSGKDTAALGLTALGWKRLAFAEPLREALVALDPYIDTGEVRPRLLSDLVATEGWDVAKRRGEVRRLLQRFGTEVGRNCFGPQFWVSRMHDRLLAASVRGERVVVTDLRFPNEAALIEGWGGKLVGIKRPGLAADAGRRHTSETELSEILTVWDFENAGSPERLQRALVEFACEVYGEAEVYGFDLAFGI